MLKSTKCEPIPRSSAGFSLVEMTLALGIAAFCLITVFGLVPIGVQTNRNATSQTAAANILSSVVSDLRASPPGGLPTAKYGIKRGKTNPTTLYFDGQGQFATSRGTNSRYRLYVQIANMSGGSGVMYPWYAWLKVSWPAAVDPVSTTVTPSGSVETVVTFFNK